VPIQGKAQAFDDVHDPRLLPVRRARRHTQRRGGLQATIRYSEELKKAGVPLALEGLYPPASGARVSFGGGECVITDGPFTEAKGVLGGYWLIDVRSLSHGLYAATTSLTRNDSRAIEHAPAEM
jgi:hypothetical protein